MITDIQKRIRLRELGYDPDSSFDSDPSIAQQNPTTEVSSTPIQPQTTKTGVLARSFGRGLPSAAAGLAAGFGVGTALDATGVGAVIGVPIQIASSLGAAYLARKAQENIAPKIIPNYTEQQNIDIKEHPVVNTLGEVASSLPFLKPSISSIPGAVRAIGNPMRGIPAAASDIGNLVNVGVGASIPVAQRVASGQDILSPETALEMLGGILLNNSTKLGMKLGANPNVIRPNNIKNIREAQINGTPIQSIKPPEPKLLPERTGPLITPYPEPATKNSLSDIQRILENAEPINKPALKTLRESNLGLISKYIPKAQNPDVNTVRQKPITEGLAKKNISDKPTKEYLEEFSKLGEQRNINTDTTKILKDNAGREVAGQTHPREALETPTQVSINPNKAGLDTPAHEYLHDFRDTLKNYGNDKEKAFIESGDKIIENSPAYQEWKKQRIERNLPSSVDEFATTLGGEDSIRRIFGTDNKGAFRNWLSDLKSNIKYKLDHANAEDIARLSSSKLIHYPEFHETFKKAGVNVKNTGESKTQDELLKSNTEEKPLAPAEFRSELKTPSGKVLEQYDLTQDIQDHPKGSTVSRKTLEDLGYKIPERVQTKIQEEPLESSKNFENWFKGSKVVDSNGKPLKVYHGTSENFDKFDLDKTGLGGFFFSSNLPEASHYATSYKPAIEGKPKGRIVDAHLSIKNPINSDKFYQTVAESEGKGNPFLVAKAKLISEGYDGVKIEGLKGKTSWIAFNPEQIKSASKNSGEYNPQDSNIYHQHEGLKFAKETLENNKPSESKTETTLDKVKEKLRFYQPEITKIEKQVPTPEGKKSAEGLTNFYEKYRELKGTLNNSFNLGIREAAGIDGISGIFKHTTPEIESAARKMYDVREGQKVNFTPKEQKIREQIQNTLQKVADIQETYPTLRQHKERDVTYIPHITDRKIIQTIQKNPLSIESKKLQKDFIAYQVPKLKARGSNDPVGEAEGNLKKILEGYNQKSPDLTKFGPIDKAEGVGLPVSWREKNALNALNRYLDRAARRFAYEDAIASKPDIAKSIETLSGNPHVKKVLENVQGIRKIDEAKLDALLGVVRSGNLGTLTGLRDFTANFTLGMQHQQNPVQSVGSWLHAFSHIKSNIADGYKSGVIRLHMNELEWSDTVNALRKVSDVLSASQGRNFLEQVTRGVSMGIGKYTTLDFHQQYLKNNLSAEGKTWFKDFGKDIDWKAKTLSPENLNKISARFVESVQGTYDYRGLPSFAMEGQLSPIFKLARWNIEKANNYQKYVLEPLFKGNYRPFLMSTLGALIGGVAVTKLTELVTGRKDKTPNFSEIDAAKESGADVKMAYLYKALGLASASGYAGMVGDMSKAVMDKMYGKNKPRWYNNMLLESANSVADSSMNFITAANDDGLSPDLAIDFASTLLENHIQLARLVLAHAGGETEKQIEDSNKRRDLRVFKTITGEGDISDNSTSEYHENFAGKKIREFKQEENLTEAAKKLPELLKDAFEKANGNPEKLREEFEKLKRNSYQTFPNPNTMPRSFVKYLAYLNKTQGNDAAQKRLMDYLKRNEINKAKSSMVP